MLFKGGKKAFTYIPPPTSTLPSPSGIEGGFFLFAPKHACKAEGRKDKYPSTLIRFAGG